MLQLLKQGAAGAAALLLACAAVALLILSLSLLVGMAAAGLLAAAGLFLGAPKESRETVKALIASVTGWIADLKGIVESAGATLLAALGKAEPPSSSAAPAQAAESTKKSEAADASRQPPAP